MTTSDHARTPLARLALAAGGIGALAATAVLAHAAAGSIGGTRGTLAVAALLGIWAVAGCGLAHSLRSRRQPGLTRPGPVRLPERAEHLEPANSAS